MGRVETLHDHHLDQRRLPPLTLATCAAGPWDVSWKTGEVGGPAQDEQVTGMLIDPRLSHQGADVAAAGHTSDGRHGQTKTNPWRL